MLRTIRSTDPSLPPIPMLGRVEHHSPRMSVRERIDLAEAIQDCTAPIASIVTAIADDDLAPSCPINPACDCLASSVDCVPPAIEDVTITVGPYDFGPFRLVPDRGPDHPGIG